MPVSYGNVKPKDTTLKKMLAYVKNELIIPLLLKEPKYCNISELKHIVKYIISQIPTFSVLAGMIFTARTLDSEYFEDVCTVIQITVINLRIFLNVICRPDIIVDEEAKKATLGNYIDAVIRETKHLIKTKNEPDSEFNRIVQNADKIIKDAIEEDRLYELELQSVRNEIRRNANTANTAAGIGVLLPPATATAAANSPTRKRSRSGSSSPTRKRSGSLTASMKRKQELEEQLKQNRQQLANVLHAQLSILRPPFVEPVEEIITPPARLSRERKAREARAAREAKEAEEAEEARKMENIKRDIIARNIEANNRHARNLLKGYAASSNNGRTSNFMNPNQYPGF